jgi:hypothetical protein
MHAKKRQAASKALCSLGSLAAGICPAWRNRPGWWLGRSSIETEGGFIGENTLVSPYIWI